MRKSIHGDYAGFYHPSRFCNFISNINGFEEVAKGFPCDLFVAYLSQQKVVVKYRTYGELKSSFPPEGKWADIELFGDENGVGEIEKMILERAEKYEKTQRKAVPI